MSNVTCPYCRAEQEINHDDGYGLEEDGDHEQDCINCDKTFKFTTMIFFEYNVYCEGEHDMEQCIVPGCTDLWECSRCDYREIRKP